MAEHMSRRNFERPSTPATILAVLVVAALAATPAVWAGPPKVQLTKTGCFGATVDGTKVFCVDFAEFHRSPPERSAYEIQISGDGKAGVVDRQVRIAMIWDIEGGPDLKEELAKVRKRFKELRKEKLDRKHLVRLGKKNGYDAKRRSGRVTSPDKGSWAKFQATTTEVDGDTKEAFTVMAGRKGKKSGKLTRYVCRYNGCEVRAVYFVKGSRTFIVEVHSWADWTAEEDAEGAEDMSEIEFMVVRAAGEPRLAPPAKK